MKYKPRSKTSFCQNMPTLSTCPHYQLDNFLLMNYELRSQATFCQNMYIIFHDAFAGTFLIRDLLLSCTKSRVDHGSNAHRANLCLLLTSSSEPASLGNRHPSGLMPCVFYQLECDCRVRMYKGDGLEDEIELSLPFVWIIQPGRIWHRLHLKFQFWQSRCVCGPCDWNRPTRNTFTTRNRCPVWCSSFYSWHCPYYGPYCRPTLDNGWCSWRLAIVYSVNWQ